ncbi:hypothetical protein KTH_40850 [Thermosporothrix hazakensis]|nr:hypothetical protein KTH_40850 [Thermosporothrix hazakensis]
MKGCFGPSWSHLRIGGKRGEAESENRTKRAKMMKKIIFVCLRSWIGIAAQLSSLVMLIRSMIND